MGGSAGRIKEVTGPRAAPGPQVCLLTASPTPATAGSASTNDPSANSGAHKDSREREGADRWAQLLAWRLKLETSASLWPDRGFLLRGVCHHSQKRSPNKLRRTRRCPSILQPWDQSRKHSCSLLAIFSSSSSSSSSWSCVDLFCTDSSTGFTFAIVFFFIHCRFA